MEIKKKNRLPLKNNKLSNFLVIMITHASFCFDILIDFLFIFPLFSVCFFYFFFAFRFVTIAAEQRRFNYFPSGWDCGLKLWFVCTCMGRNAASYAKQQQNQKQPLLVLQIYISKAGQP